MSEVPEVTQHFVTFYSAGTFVAETTTLPIDEWDVADAVEKSKGVVERHNSRPYAFRFTTRGRGPDDLDSHETASSGYWFLGGNIRTLAEVESKDDPSEKILRANMRANDWQRVVTVNKPWKWTQPLGERDAVLFPNVDFWSPTQGVANV